MRVGEAKLNYKTRVIRLIEYSRLQLVGANWTETKRESGLV